MRPQGEPHNGKSNPPIATIHKKRPPTRSTGYRRLLYIDRWLMRGDYNVKRFFWIAYSLVIGMPTAWSQQVAELNAQNSELKVEGWQGFTDFVFLGHSFLTLTLAAVLGAIIAYHPKYRRAADTFEEIEAPKIYIMYAVIGALVGIMVVKYGLVIGFVLFGIGGLIRFRTVLKSADMTGHVILVTLIGLLSGLEMPHIAVLSTVFGFVLIYVLHARTTCLIQVRAMPQEVVVEAAAAYRSVLQQHGCRILHEKKNPEKGRVSFIFSFSSKVSRSHLAEALEAEIDARFKGSLDWEID